MRRFLITAPDWGLVDGYLGSEPTKAEAIVEATKAARAHQKMKLSDHIVVVEEITFTLPFGWELVLTRDVWDAEEFLP